MTSSVTGTRHRVLPHLVELGLVAVAAIDVFTSLEPDAFNLGVAFVGCLGLVVRRRWPYPVFVLTLPAAWLLAANFASLIALYTIGALERDRRRLAGCAVAVVICDVAPSPMDDTGLVLSGTFLGYAAFSAALAAAPAFLGQLQLARRNLAERLQEIIAAREQEDRLLAQTVLAVERAQLAREMHDVVSHQVSLIAVHAGALLVSTERPATREAADTIRQLSVRTLDELRHLVTLLRASGSTPTEIAPQPTLDALPCLVAGSGLPARLTGTLSHDVSSAHQRAIYRTVQEALTNIRKHAPGATAAIHLDQDQTGLSVLVTNSRPTQSPMLLPSARHGLVGLRERAQLLGGTLTAGGTPDHGYRVHLRLPLPYVATEEDHSVRMGGTCPPPDG
ncbi:MAG TPA: histidine kinase [Kineosporiaceae bacterium]